MYRKTYQVGFIIPPIIIILGIVLTVGLGTVIYQKRTTDQLSTQNSPQTTPSATPQPSATPTPQPKSTKTPIPPKSPTTSPKPTTSPTPAPVTNSSPSNSYDLNSPTGSVKVMVKAQNGNLGFTPSAELSTISGFKVLDGRSTDKITQFGLNRTDELRGEIVFSTAPPGPYKVRISYNGQWSDQKDVTVQSAKQAYVEFTVAGVAPTPIPTPKPKPVCNVIVMPSNIGTAPFEASVCVGNHSNPYQDIKQEFVDYNGDGSWDYQGASWGCHSYTFQSPGTYSPKAKIIGSSGDESDICQTTATIN